MKAVIRRGVFETNSSSTHTLTIVKTGDTAEREVSFEICSPVAKLFMIFGLVENAERCSGKGCCGWPKELMLRFKEQAIAAFCDIKGLTREETLYEIECEAFGNTSLKKVLGDEARLREYIKKDSRLAAEFKASKHTDIVAFADEYFKRELAITKEMMNGRYCCDAYFYNGCLIECDCGFETHRKMASRFGIDRYDTDEQLYEKAREFLSDGCKMLAAEYNAGIEFMETNDKY